MNEAYVIINDGECCHYQIEGGIFTSKEKAEAFADSLAGEGRYERDHLRVTPVKVDPTINDFPRPYGDKTRTETSIWPD